MDAEYHRALVEGERIGSAYVLVPPRATRAGLGGSRTGNRPGSSFEFRDYRDYEPGDDLRQLDWGVFARSDKLTVKRHQEEVSPHLDILLDGSRSMKLTGTGKAVTALGLTALLASAAANASIPVSVWIVGNELRRLPAQRPSLWDSISFDFAGNPSVGLAAAQPFLKPWSMRVLISDLLWPAMPDSLLRSFGHGAAGVVVIQVLAAEDVRPDLHGSWRLVDCETQETHDVFFDAAAARRYEEAFVRHRESWEIAARQAYSVYVKCVAEESGGQLLFPELAASEVLRPA